MNKHRPSAKTFRCAVYTRKSTEERLQQEFNSLDAQREAAEAFVKSQAHEGWTLLTDRYDDGGFTGGNMDRPALTRMIADIEAGRIDCVVVYKVDRLSRSLLDFARMMEVFDRRRVSFVSVTQQFNTTHSMGRLTLNVLLSFAQFEREIISERTRDKIAATHRKGKWTGGMPILGYDVDPRGSKLVVNAEEAERVRAIFDLYLDKQSLVAAIAELDQRGWTNKRWQTRKGGACGGSPFSKASLHRLLSNVVYVGKVRYKTEVHAGEHVGIVEPSVWRKVQTLLQRNARGGGESARQHTVLLRGLLRCSACDTGMTHTYAKKGGKLYRYYSCSNALGRGRHTCTSKSVPAGEIERFVVDRIRCIGRDPVLVGETLEQAAIAAAKRRDKLAGEQRRLERELRQAHRSIATVGVKAATSEPGSDAPARLADLQEQVRQAETGLAAIRDEIEGLAALHYDEDAFAKALEAFDPVWEVLTVQEQARVLNLLIERIDYDGARGRIAIAFHPTGIQSLASEIDALSEASR